MKDFSDFGIEIPYGVRSGFVRLYCPQCHNQRQHHKREKSLSVNVEEGWWRCHHCGWHGNILSHNEDPEAKKEWMKKQSWYRSTPIRKKKMEYKKPKPNNNTHLSDRLLAWFKKRGISEETVRACKITEGLEVMPTKDRQVNTVQFNYYLNGELVNTKYRTGDKCFKMCSGARLIPWMIDNIKGEKECIITEGEMDALSFYEIGYHNVVSVPNGASGNAEYLDDFIDEYFEDKETIYVASDTDEKGVELKDELLRRFGAERCRVVTYGTDCKDANDVLQKHGTDALKQCLLDAPEIKVDGVFTVSDVETDLDVIFNEGLKQGYTIGHQNFDQLCSFETKRLCVITGVPGCLNEDTLVSMSDGTLKAIKDIKFGDLVMSLDSNYNLVSKPVINKWDSGSKECFRIETRDGHFVEATDIHRFLTFDGWKEVKEISKGDFVAVPVDKIDNNCRWKEIKSISKIGERHTFDIEIKDTHNFIANGIVSHNSGKSEFIDEIAENMNIRYQWKFAYFSPENAPITYHISKLIEKFTGKKFRRDTLPINEYQQVKAHIERNFFFIYPKDDYKLSSILQRAKYLVRKKGIKGLVIDPYNRLEDENDGQSETRYISKQLDMLTNFAQQNDVLVFLMAHPTKLQKNKDGVIDPPTLYDISGSAHFYNKTDFGIVVHRDRSRGLVDIIVQKVKFRHLGTCGTASFVYNIENGRYTPIICGVAQPHDFTNHLILKNRQDEEEAYANSEMFVGGNDHGVIKEEMTMARIKPMDSDGFLPAQTDNVPF